MTDSFSSVVCKFSSQWPHGGAVRLRCPQSGHFSVCRRSVKPQWSTEAFHVQCAAPMAGQILSPVAFQGFDVRSLRSVAPLRGLLPPTACCLGRVKPLRHGPITCTTFPHSHQNTWRLLRWRVTAYTLPNKSEQLPLFSENIWHIHAVQKKKNKKKT